MEDGLSLDQLEQALRSAHSKAQAGDAQARDHARMLAAEFARRRSEEPGQEQAERGAAPESGTSNPLMGAVARAAGLGSALLSGAARARDWRKKNLYSGTILPDAVEEGVKGAAGSLKDFSDSINYSPREGISWGDVKSKAGAGDYGAALTTLAELGATTTIASLPDMLLAAGPGVVPYVIARTEEILQERQKNNQGAELTPTDFGAALATALASSALERAGAKGIFSPKAATAPGRVAGAAGREGATEAAQNPLEEIGTRAGTENEVTGPELLDSSLEGLLVGGTGGGIVRGTGEAVNAVPPLGGRAAELRAEARARRMAERFRDNPEALAAQVRAANMIDRDRQEALTPVPDTEEARLARSEWKDLWGGFERLTRALYDADEITKDELQALTKGPDSVLAQAANSAAEARDLDLAKIDGLSRASEETKAILKRAARDANLMAQQGKQYKQRGPIEEAARGMRSSITRGALALGGGPVGMAAALVPSRAIEAGGRMIDRALELRRPTVLRNAKVKRRAAELLELKDTDDTRDRLREATEDARQRITLFKATDNTAPVNREALSAWDGESRSMGVTQLGGWRDAAIRHGSERKGVAIDDRHLERALDDAVRLGVITAQDREKARNYGFSPVEDVYYRLQDRAAHYAAEEAGKAGRSRREEQKGADTENAKVKARRRREVAADGAVQEDQAAQQLRAMQLMILARATTPENLRRMQEQAERPRAPRKPREPRTAPLASSGATTTGNTATAPGEAQGSTTGASPVRNPLAYQATIQNAQRARDIAIEEAGDRSELRTLVMEVERRKTKAARQRIIAEAAERFKDDPAALQFVLGPLATLARIGGTSEVAEEARLRRKATATSR